MPSDPAAEEEIKEGFLEEVLFRYDLRRVGIKQRKLETGIG